MQLTLRLLKLIALLFFIIVFFSIGFKLNYKSDAIKERIDVPKNTLLYARINPKALFFGFALYAIFDARDQELFDRLKSNNSSEEAFQDYGIDFTSDVELFFLRNTLGVHPLVKFKITNSDALKKNLSGFNYFIEKDNVFISTNNSILNNFKDSQNLVPIYFDKKQSISILEFFNKSLYSTTSIDVSKDEIIIETKFENNFVRRYLLPNKSGFSMAFDVTENLQELIQPFYNNVDSNKIKYINFDYRGFDIESKIPDFNLVVQFERELSIIDWTEKILKYLNIEYTLDEKEGFFEINNKRLFFKRIDFGCYVLGLDTSLVPKLKTIPPRYFAGNINALIRVKDNGIIGKTINALPLYHSIDEGLKKLYPIKTEFNTNQHKSITTVKLKDNKSYFELMSDMLKSDNIDGFISFLESKSFKALLSFIE